jgi:hypothetical protein
MSTFNSSSKAASRLIVTFHCAQGLSATVGCHSERSEESRPGEREILRCAQNDKGDDKGALRWMTRGGHEILRCAQNEKEVLRWMTRGGYVASFLAT